VPDFDRNDEDNISPKPNKRSEDDVRRFRESLRNGGKDINNPEALEEIIQFYFEHEKFEEASTYADRLLSFEPFNADAWQRKGMILNNLFRYNEALDCFDKALGLNPIDPEAYINRGITLDNLNRITESMASFDKALELDSSH
jgi:tetratricopeptide (TPR) repeat protein